MPTGLIASTPVRGPDHSLAIASCRLFNYKYLQIFIKIYLAFCIDPANINRPLLFTTGSAKVPWTCPPIRSS
jgi:hypothetical protein